MARTATDDFEGARVLEANALNGVITLNANMNAIYGDTEGVLQNPGGKRTLYLMIESGSFRVRPGSGLSGGGTEDAVLVAFDYEAGTVIWEGHGLASGAGPFQFVAGDAGVLPVGITAATNYYAVPIDANEFQIATSNGNAIAVPPVTEVFTTNGLGEIWLQQSPTSDEPTMAPAAANVTDGSASLKLTAQNTPYIFAAPELLSYLGASGTAIMVYWYT